MIKFPRVAISARISREIADKLDAICKRDRTTRSKVVEHCLKRYLSESKKYTNISVEKTVHHGKLTDGDQGVIALYREVYGYRGRIFYAAVKSALNARRRDGLRQSDLEHCVRVSLKDEWIAQRVAANPRTPPPLHEILTEKMVGRLIQIPSDGGASVKSSISLDQMKISAIDKLWDIIPDADRDNFREAVLSCKTQEELSEIENRVQDSQAK